MSRVSFRSETSHSMASKNYVQNNVTSCNLSGNRVHRVALFWFLRCYHLKLSEVELSWNNLMQSKRPFEPATNIETTINRLHNFHLQLLRHLYSFNVSNFKGENWNNKKLNLNFGSRHEAKKMFNVALAQHDIIRQLCNKVKDTYRIGSYWPSRRRLEQSSP